MREFDYEKLAEKTWDKEVLNYIGLIHEYKGRQQLYLEQKPEELDKLVELAKNQSTQASNEIEGIRTTNSRLKQLMADKTTPKNRDENEILGYRYALNLVHESFEYIPIRPNFITININDGEVILKDNGNGKIPSVNGILQQAGTVDYGMGKIQLN